MTRTELIELLLTNLNINMPKSKSEVQHKIYDNLAYLADVAVERIRQLGITFEGEETFTIDEANLVIMYASWLYTKRQTGEGMPRMLRYALNNKLLSQKAAENA